MVLLAVVGWFGELPYAYLPAQKPAPLHSVAVQGTGYDRSFTMLGNHGLLVDCGSEAVAAQKTVPTLFYAGYTPAALLLTSKRAREGGGAACLERQWPGLPVIHAEELPAEGVVLETQAGRDTIYPAPAGQPPLVLWENPAGRVLYIGHAAYTAYQPFSGLNPDIAVLGSHARQPVQRCDVSAARLVLLPGVQDPAAMDQDEYVQLILTGKKDIPESGEAPRDAE